MSAIEELQAAIQGVASGRRPVRRRDRPASARLGRRHRRRPGPDQCPQRPRRAGHRHLRRRALDGRPARRDRRRRRPGGDRGRHGRRKALDWGAGDGLATGAAVFGAAASPSGGTRVTFGTVSAVARAFRGPGGRRIGGSVEHTAPLAPGSSGGPIVDADGRFLGLNTNRLGEGFYLALPADAALRERVDALGRGDRVERPRLGVSIAPAHVARRLQRSVGLPERDGLLVRDVEDGSPAARAGIAQGDLIVAVAGKTVSDADELLEAIATAGDSYEVKIVRGTEERTVIVGGAAASGEA